MFLIAGMLWGGLGVVVALCYQARYGEKPWWAFVLFLVAWTALLAVGTVAIMGNAAFTPTGY